jgi:hypothetical protein
MSASRLPPCPSYSQQAWDQLKAKSRKQLLRMIQRDERWERMWGKAGHPAFINRRLSPPHNIIVVHVHPVKKNCPHILKETLAKLGWTEPYLREMGYVK